nr:hypothetical protein OH837_17445 [Streptomyces canus]
MLNGPIRHVVAAHIVGAILLGVALLRGGVIPARAAWLPILSMPLNVAGYVIGIAALIALSSSLRPSPTSVSPWTSATRGFARAGTHRHRLRGDPVGKTRRPAD